MPTHLEEVRSRKLDLLSKTEAAVKERLTKEIAYWDHRAADLQIAGASRESRTRASTHLKLAAGPMTYRGDLQKRMDEIQRERQLSPLPPVVLGGVLVVPAGLLRKMVGSVGVSVATRDTQAAAARARAAVMDDRAKSRIRACGPRVGQAGL